MTKLHELLAAEKTPTAAWNAVREETIKKFKNPDHFFHGHDRSLEMIEDTAANNAEQAMFRVSKPVTTTVYATLDFALGLFARAENLQYQKNATNRMATGTVLWNGEPLLQDLPVDELLGLESRLGDIRKVIDAAPTLDATKHWVPAPDIGSHVFQLKEPERKTKTRKTIRAILLSPATDKHPAQVHANQEEDNVGIFIDMKRSGACTAAQKANALVRIDTLIVEVKQARMRANETVAVDGKIADKLVQLILEPFKVQSQN